MLIELRDAAAHATTEVRREGPVLCTANSCRSQMAEAWARRLFPAGWEAASAGLITYPITDRTLAAMAEAGVAMDGQFSKPFDGFVWTISTSW